LPRSLAVILTFAICGFLLHNLPLLAYTGVPLITLWFILLGAGVVVGELLRMNLSRQRYLVRAAVNLLYLSLTFEAARRIAVFAFQ
jgi:hypothetical protein